MSPTSDTSKPTTDTSVSGLKRELKSVLMSLLSLLDCDSDADASPETTDKDDSVDDPDKTFEALCVAQDWSGLVAHLKSTQMPLDHGHIMCIIQCADTSDDDRSYILGCAVEASCLDYDDLRTSLVPLAIVMPEWALDFFTPELKTNFCDADMLRVMDGIFPDTQRLTWFVSHGFMDCHMQETLLSRVITAANPTAFHPLRSGPFELTEGMLAKYLKLAHDQCTPIYDMMVADLWQLLLERS